MIVLFVLAATGFLAAAAGAAQVRPLKVRSAKLSPAIISIARKWARKRELPERWVLATILLESGGNPNARRASAREDSYGLMQINVRAHGARLAAAGVSFAQLFNPETNIEWGTRIMREIYDQLGVALKHPPSGELLRLAYRGPALIVSALRAGRDPRHTYPQVVLAWNQALARTAALV